MSRYGLDIYGVGAYGIGVTTLVDFDASPFIAYPIDYKKIQLQWSVPSGNWDEFRLVRNRYGFPLTSDDGDVLLDVIKIDTPNYFTDDGSLPYRAGLTEGVDYYYSIFVLKSEDGFWAKAGDAVTISAKQYTDNPDFYSLLPAVFQTKSYKTLSDNADNDDLKSFLKVFEMYHDFIKTYAELLLKVYDPTVTHNPVISYMMQQFGAKYEPELGIQQSRIFLRNIALINKSKGSIQGLIDFIKAFTGWEPVVIPTVNLMLTFNDSSFEESVGFWQSISNGTLSVASALIVSPYSESTLPTLFPNKQDGSLKVIAVASGSVELACGLSSIKTRGIPVEPGFPYTFSVYTRAASTARKVVVDIRWYDRDGIELSRAGEQNKTNTTTGWNTRVYTTNTAPDDAYFAIPYIRIDGCASSEIHYFDAAQFEVNAEGPSNFEEARGVKIYLLPNRVNLIENPCFESLTAPWEVEEGSIVRVNDISVGAATNSDYSLEITPTSSSPVKLKHDSFIPIDRSEWYTFSGYVRTAYTGSYINDRRGGFLFDWYDGAQNYISTTGATDLLLTEYYETYSFYRTNNVLTINTNSLTSLSVGDQVRLVDFDGTYGDTEVSGVDGTYTVTSVNSTTFQVTSAGSNIPTLLKSTFGLTSSDWLVQDLKLDFVVESETQLAPSNAEYVKPYFQWTNPSVGEKIWVDSFMLEKSTTLKEYFDGSTGVSEADDLIWEGTANQSRSYYYKNRNAVEKRLIREIPNYLFPFQWYATYVGVIYKA